LKTKEFVHVLLPWVTELSDILSENKNNQDLLSQQVVSDLIEVLINMMNDSQSNIDAMQKSEIHRIYENLSEAYSFK